jgi:hypothetical protein
MAMNQRMSSALSLPMPRIGIPLVTVLLAVVSGAPLTGLLLQEELGPQLAPLFGLLALLLALQGSIFLAILIHEMGHVLACWLIGFWLYQCKLGPLLFTRTRRGFQLQVSHARLYWGYALACPLDERRLRLRKAILAAGGPLASLVLVVVLGWLYALQAPAVCAGLPAVAYLANGLLVGTNAQGMSAEHLFTSWLAWTFLLALFTWCGTLLPYTSRRGIQSDGLKLLWCVRGSPQIERELVLSRLLGQTLCGVRPRAWPDGLAERLMAALARFPEDRSLLVYAYYLTLERGQISEAGTFLDRAILTDGGAPTVEATLALEVAYFAARYRGSPTASRAWLAQSTPGASQFETLMRPRAQAAIFLLEDRVAEAERAISAGLAALARIKATSLHELQMEEEDLRELLREAKWRQSTPDGEDLSPTAGVSAPQPWREYDE